VIQEQVEMGVAVRMAVMEALLDPRRNQESRNQEGRGA
ncbi:MAG: aspartate carbamoyltransferase catalytic subunit, partial [Mesorhizobium sp.]